MTGMRAQQRMTTQKVILATARKLFLAASFDSVGVREIAAEAGVATGTVIAAFGSKVDLLHEIVVEDMNEQLELMHAAVLGVESTYERICNICLACITFQVARIAIVRASMADAWTRSDEAENKIRKAIRPVYNFIMHELERGIGRGEIRGDLNVKVGAILVMETLVNTYRVPLYDEKPLGELGDLLCARLDIILRGFGVSEVAYIGETKRVSGTRAA